MSRITLGIMPVDMVDWKENHGLSKCGRATKSDWFELLLVLWGLQKDAISATLPILAKAIDVAPREFFASLVELHEHSVAVITPVPLVMDKTTEYKITSQEIRKILRARGLNAERQKRFREGRKEGVNNAPNNAANNATTSVINGLNNAAPSVINQVNNALSDSHARLRSSAESVFFCDSGSVASSDPGSVLVSASLLQIGARVGGWRLDQAWMEILGVSPQGYGLSESQEHLRTLAEKQGKPLQEVAENALRAFKTVIAGREPQYQKYSPQAFCRAWEDVQLVMAGEKTIEPYTRKPMRQGVLPVAKMDFEKFANVPSGTIVKNRRG